MSRFPGLPFVSLPAWARPGPGGSGRATAAAVVAVVGISALVFGFAHRRSGPGGPPAPAAPPPAGAAEAGSPLFAGPAPDPRRLNLPSFPVAAVPGVAAFPAPAPAPAAPSPAATAVPGPSRRAAAVPGADPAEERRQALARDLPAVGRTLRGYRAAFGTNPVGDNAMITRALAGGNPGATNFLAGAEVTRNDRGELIDRWGQAYYFHQLSGTRMQVRSAGPDGRLFTEDDLVWMP